MKFKIGDIVFTVSEPLRKCKVGIIKSYSIFLIRCYGVSFKENHNDQSFDEGNLRLATELEKELYGEE